MNDDYDTPWKDALTRYFPEFVAFYFPVAHRQIDRTGPWKPDSFGYELFGCEMGIRFPYVKLNDYAGRLPQLLQEQNVFGLVTAAHLLTQQTKGRHVKRHAVKWYLARILYERNWDKQRIVDLFNIIDWMMQIPPSLQSQLMRDIAKLERKKGMPYLSSFERRGLERGLEKGLEKGLEQGRQEGLQALSGLVARQLTKRFGPLPAPVKDRLAHATPADLQAWGEAVLDAPTLDGVFQRR